MSEPSENVWAPPLTILALSYNLNSFIYLVTKNSDIEVYLRHPDRVGGGAVKVKALIVFIPITLRSIHDVVTRGGLHILTIPACRELDVDLQL